MEEDRRWWIAVGILMDQETKDLGVSGAQLSLGWLNASAKQDGSKNGKSLIGDISKNKRIKVIAWKKLNNFCTSC